MTHRGRLLSLALASGACAWALVLSTSPPGEVAAAEAGEELSGGETTVFDTTRNAFSLAAANLSNDRKVDFFVGNSFFNENWVAAPASTEGRDGLGPVFNARSCSGCHFKDGRARPDADEGLLVRLSVASGGDEPNYDGQLQPFALPGVPAEGRLEIEYEEAAGTFADGEAFSLRRPTYRFRDLAFGPMAPDVRTSPRIAPPVFGLGLLSAVTEASILARADPEDADGDGVSGRPNRVRGALGRFGWKANQPSIADQVAGAFLGDMGLTTPIHPVEDAPAAQTARRAAPGGGEPEVPARTFEQVVYYTMVLGVPARRDWTLPEVRRGRDLFRSAGCASCHVPEMTTGALEGFPELSGQTIRPYTDLLLHDLGDGLADGRPDHEATGREWRTPPLWGIGLVETVNRHTTLLHDGRARGFEEAILWHGGEAEASRERFRRLSKSDRRALVRFLRSL